MPASLQEELVAAGLKHAWVHQAPRFGRAGEDGLVIFESGKGCLLTDITGREVFDGMSGAWVVNVGHGRTEIADAIGDQARRLAYASAFNFLTEPAIRLAEKLALIAPEPLERVFLCSGGAEAVEAALAMARQYYFNIGQRGRYKIISRRGSYHGSAFGGKSVSGLRHNLLQQRFAPLLEGCIQVAGPNTYRTEDDLDPRAYAIRCAREIERAILHEGPDSVAAVIGEPISASAGVQVPDREYWQIVRDVCTRHGILLILDEVLVGMGRTGKMFAFEHYGVVPDIVTLSKGIASGYAPIGAVVVSKTVAESFAGDNVFSHGYTYGSHPVASAAGLRNIEILEREELVGASATTGAYMHERLNGLAQRYRSIGDVRGLGMIAAIELVADRGSKTPFPVEAKMSQRLADCLLDEGIFLRVWDVIHVAPPLVATREDIDRMVDGIGRAIGRFERDIGFN
ncbi:MAG: aspartate aminotransferase family protein [Bauldia sp.]|nr:aspartate aminotransferase family protein [Bauldia sp.]